MALVDYGSSDEDGAPDISDTPVPATPLSSVVAAKPPPASERNLSGAGGVAAAAVVTAGTGAAQPVAVKVGKTVSVVGPRAFTSAGSDRITGKRERKQDFFFRTEEDEDMEPAERLRGDPHRPHISGVSLSALLPPPAHSTKPQASATSSAVKNATLSASATRTGSATSAAVPSTPVTSAEDAQAEPSSVALAQQLKPSVALAPDVSDEEPLRSARGDALAQWAAASAPAGAAAAAPLPIDDYRSVPAHADEPAGPTAVADARFLQHVRTGGRVIEIHQSDLRQGALAPQPTDVRLGPSIPSVNAPGQTARKKHQITSLAFNARALEEQLEEQRISGAKTRSQTLNKYGW